MTTSAFIRYARNFDGSHPGARPKAKTLFQRWYARYLASRSWDAKRGRVLERDGWRCVDCGHPASQVHHVTYRRVGFERLTDLVSLCGECHRTRHGVRR